MDIQWGVGVDGRGKACVGIVISDVTDSWLQGRTGRCRGMVMQGTADAENFEQNAKYWSNSTGQAAFVLV